MHLSLILLCVFSEVSDASITITSHFSAFDEAEFLLLRFFKCSQIIGVPMTSFPAPRQSPIIMRRFFSQDMSLLHISLPQTKKCYSPSRRRSPRGCCIPAYFRSFCFFSPWQSRSFGGICKLLCPTFFQRNQARSHPRGFSRLLSFHASAYARCNQGIDALEPCVPFACCFP